MQDHHVTYLDALLQAGNLVAAARACAMAPDLLRAELAELERQYGRTLLSAADQGECLTPVGIRLAQWANRFRSPRTGHLEPLARERLSKTLAPLLQRRSVSPRKLMQPGPGKQEIEAMTAAAMTAPDHGQLHPWRLIQFGPNRHRLADLFVAEKLRRDPFASPLDVSRARQHALQPPVLLAFVVSPQTGKLVPTADQWLCAGAALGNFLNAAHQLGYGAIVLGGDRCLDEPLRQQLGVQTHEHLAGFISMGSLSGRLPARQGPHTSSVLTTWQPVDAAQTDQADMSARSASNSSRAASKALDSTAL